MRNSPVKAFLQTQRHCTNLALTAMQAAQSDSLLQRSHLRLLQQTHETDINFLLQEIVSLRSGFSAMEQKCAIKCEDENRQRRNFVRQLNEKQEQIGKLKRMLVQNEERNEQERREMQSAKELERSRASGAVGSRREASQFMEKQLRKLSEETLEKTILIQNISRELTKEKKKKQDAIRAIQKSIDIMKQEHTYAMQSLLTTKQNEILLLKQQITSLKNKLKEKHKEIDSLLIQYQQQKKSKQLKQQKLKWRQQQSKKLKQAMQQIREQHIQQITNLMKQRKKKSSNMGSSRSLSSSNVDLGSGRLPPVKEECSPERELQKSVEEEESQFAKAVFHYDSLLSELKKSHALELDYYKGACQRLEQSVRRKQLELQDALTTFTPLLSLESKAKEEHIEGQWKAGVAILDVLLKTNKISIFY